MKTKQFSLDSLKSLWLKSWNEELPSGRLPAGETQLGFYPVTNFKVALDEEGRPVAYRGWSESNGYFMLGMSFTKEEWRGKGIFNLLEPPMKGKVILGLSQRNSTFSNEDWVNTWERKGFTINPTPEQIEEIFGNNTSTTKEFANFYANKQGKGWAIKNLASIAKWFNIVKRGGRYGR